MVVCCSFIKCFLLDIDVHYNPWIKSFLIAMKNSFFMFKSLIVNDLIVCPLFFNKNKTFVN